MKVIYNFFVQKCHSTYGVEVNVLSNTMTMKPDTVTNLDLTWVQKPFSFKIVACSYTSSMSEGAIRYQITRHVTFLIYEWLKPKMLVLILMTLEHQLVGKKLVH